MPLLQCADRVATFRDHKWRLFVITYSWDNAVAESFFATLKTELVYRTTLPTVAAAKSSVFEYIEVFYNRQRIHSALGYQSPAAYELGRLHQPEAAPAA